MGESKMMTISPAHGLFARIRERTLIRTRLAWALRRARYNRFGYETGRNLLWDLRYGGWCGGFIPSRFYDFGAHGVRSASYHELEKIFSPGNILPGPDDVLVDIGCGKGRVLNYWLERFPENRIIGVELDDQVADRTRQRLRRWENVRIVTGDAVSVLPAEGTIFWMFNPFKEHIFRAFRDRLKVVSTDITRVKILYYKTLFLNVWTEDPFWSVRPLELGLFPPGSYRWPSSMCALIEAAD